MKNLLDSKKLVLLALILAVISCARTNGPMNGGVDFYSIKVENSEVQRVFSAARENDKRVLLIFDADWCPSCRKLNNVVLKDPNVKNRLRGFEVLNVDVDEHPQVLNSFARGSKIFKGNSIPSILIFGPDGKQTDQIIGLLDAKRFERRLRRNL